ncbi:MAG TPA: hypothetical protein VFR70_03050 [Flavobacterium sp.]|nr:hypothetical protein [Flavobacterium sp.]
MQLVYAGLRQSLSQRWLQEIPRRKGRSPLALMPKLPELSMLWPNSIEASFGSRKTDCRKALPVRFK